MLEKIVFVAVLCYVSGWTESKHLHQKGLGIIGGHDVQISQFPWQVSIHHNGVFARAGILISPNWVLTSYDYSNHKNITIRAGSTFWESGGQVVDVKRRVPHPDAHPDKPENNLVLFELTSPVTETVAKPAILPLANTDISDNAIVEVVGWGRINASATFYPMNLKGVQLPVVTRYYCRKQFDGKYNVTENMFCAGGTKTSTTCYGDDGGSVSFGKTVVGIVNNWGVHCDLSTLPSIFMMLSKYRDWIKSIVGV